MFYSNASNSDGNPGDPAYNTIFSSDILFYTSTAITPLPRKCVRKYGVTVYNVITYTLYYNIIYGRINWVITRRYDDHLPPISSTGANCAVARFTKHYETPFATYRLSCFG